MTSLDFLHYVVSVSVIIIALTIVGIGILFGLLLVEARKGLRALKKTSEDIQELKSSIQSDIIGSVITFGRRIFAKRNE